MSAAPTPVDLLVAGRLVVTMDAAGTVVENGAVAVRGDSIVDIGPLAALRQRCAPARTIHARDGLVMPGLIDGHTHLAMTLFRGMADDLALDTWLQQYIWPTENATLTPETIGWGTRLACAELVRTGVTTVCDMYFYAQDVAAAVRSIGLRGIVGQAVVDFPGPQQLDPDANLAYIEELIARWKGDARIIPAVAPHAPTTVSPPLLQRAHALAQQRDVPLLIHLSETKDEVAQIQKQYGATPVHHLDGLGVLDARLIAAHCVWLDDGEISLLAQRGVGVVHNPRSNLKLADGIAPVPALLAAGAHVGLGTDGAASNNQLDLFAEIDAAALIHKAVRLDPRVMPAPTVIEMATIGGARALGLDHLVGSLEPGKRADLVILDLDEDNLVPLYNPLSHLAYAARSADVRTVLVDGLVVLENRHLRTADEREIRQQVRKIATQIAARRKS